MSPRSAPTDSIGASRAARLAALAALPAALAIPIAGWLDRPLVLAAAVAGALAIVASVALARRHGSHALWIGAIALSILAGELSAVSLGGQSGRLLWADLVVGAGALAALARGNLAFTVAPAHFLFWLLAWIGWSAATVLLARDPLTAIAELKEWAVAWTVAVAAFAFAVDRARARLLLHAIAWVAAIVAVLMIVAAARSPFGWVLAVLLKKVDLSWGRSNYLAGLLILGIPLTVGLLGSEPRWKIRLLGIGLLILQALGLALSASKGAILSLALGMTLSYAAASRASRTSLAVMLLVFAAGSLLFLAGPLHQVLAYRMQTSALEYSVGERVDLYELAWQSFLASPLWGLGLNNFSVASNRLTGVDTVPHHLELGWLAELGLPGLLLGLAWIASLGVWCWRARAGDRPAPDRTLGLALWAAFLAFFLHNQIESTLYGEQYKILFVLFAAAAWRHARMPGEARISEIAPAPSTGSCGVHASVVPSGFAPGHSTRGGAERNG